MERIRQTPRISVEQPTRQLPSERVASAARALTFPILGGMALAAMARENLILARKPRHARGRHRVQEPATEPVPQERPAQEHDRRADLEGPREAATKSPPQEQPAQGNGKRADLVKAMRAAEERVGDAWITAQETGTSNADERRAALEALQAAQAELYNYDSGSS